uniref:Uncharacterized protein n=1 Tax=Arundo donax TaxID=35708 RepID=A0A0A9DZX1_ARUDO
MTTACLLSSATDSMSLDQTTYLTVGAWSSPRTSLCCRSKIATLSSVLHNMLPVPA